MNNSRKAFSLIVSIVLLVLFSSITGLILSLSSESSTTTTKLYLYNQAKLYSMSGIEIALLMIANREKNSSTPLQELNLTIDNFKINILINYIGSYMTTEIYENNFSDTNGTVMVDAFVSTTNFNENITFHRRTVQKP